ncbi:uncharacterized protein [Palaemon carinicauda]|uniref:uncharacterized protein n=1 Tax=Palaemon carinicauda TaxID=392227 RepID=UPI0035B63A43
MSSVANALDHTRIFLLHKSATTLTVTTNSADRYSNTSDHYSNNSDRYSNNSDCYGNNSDRYNNNSDCYKNNSDRYTTPLTVYTNNSDRDSNNSDRYSKNSDRDSKISDRYNINSTEYEPLPKVELKVHCKTFIIQVWSGKGVGVQCRGTGEVDWTRSQFVQDCVREHNKLRALHGAPPLSLSDQLCTEAQTWANRLAHYSLLEYSSEYGRGENILTSVSKKELSGSAVAKAWYETGRSFKYDVNGSADLAQAGPFSQVVWESTRAVGIGFARGTDGRTVVVARYWPPGNIGGQFSMNVKPSVNEKEPDKNRGPMMSRTRQEAHFYVSIALEPPGKVKKCEREKFLSGFRFPRKKVPEESLSSETLLPNAATIDSLIPTTPVRNGAARTSKLFPICCVTPAKTEERWAQPSARSYRHLQQQQQASRLEPEELDVGTIRRSGRGAIPILKEDQIETISYSPHHSEDFSPNKKSILRTSPRSSPRLAPSPRLGEFSKLSSGPKLTLSPRHGASPKPGSSPRLGATSRLKALSGSGEHGVVIATL